eukprot:TRINITY_DN5755_c0_g1_i1.p1 TRINITY_DN5755_c0_g1~~TRINITY_DN5755_c0_g1_i1.p1  ORF type:complete len:147 (+),score=33.23 TRINITY_DN5755_c0_g1_i1:47-487(+)
MVTRGFLVLLAVGVCYAERCGDVAEGCGEGYICVNDDGKDSCVPRLIDANSGGNETDSGNDRSGSDKEDSDSSASGSAFGAAGSKESDSESGDSTMSGAKVGLLVGGIALVAAIAAFAVVKVRAANANRQQANDYELLKAPQPKEV